MDNFTKQLTLYLQSLDLPSDNVLVSVPERRKVLVNLAGVVELLTREARTGATYVSKFVAAVGVGLFDAALNYLWDETVQNLRTKVARFDLEYFYNSVITDPARRRQFRTEEDLVELDDWELIRGCRTTGVLSDIGFNHLDYIRNMRNWASAAHPNQNQLSGLQLISWLETCIREVLARVPEGPVIEVRRLLHNIRSSVLSASDVPPIAGNIELLPPDLTTSLLRTVFGMYTDPDMAATARNNIALIGPSVWQQAPDDTRHEVALKYQVFAANAEVARRDGAHEFLQKVGGLSYLPEDALAVQLEERIRNLEQAHLGYNNFYNEGPHAKALADYVPATGKIPNAVRQHYVKVLVMSRIGNGHGIANAARPYYDELIERFQEPEIRAFVNLVIDTEVSSRLQFSSCATRLKTLAQELSTRTRHPLILRALSLIVDATAEQLPQLRRSTDMQRALEALSPKIVH